MTVEYSWEATGLYRHFTNKINGQEVLNDNLNLQGDSRFDDIKYVINDFTDIADFDFSDIDIQKISITDKVASISNPTIKIAIITTIESLLVWIELYCKSMEGSLYDCKIFDNSEDAYKWVSG